MKLLLVSLLTVNASVIPSLDTVNTQAQVAQPAAPVTPASGQGSEMLKTFHSIYQDAVKTAIKEIDKRLGQKPKEQVVYVHINPAIVPKMNGLGMGGAQMALVARPLMPAQQHYAQPLITPQTLYAQPLGIQPPAQQQAQPLILQGHYAQQLSTLPIILNDPTHHQNTPAHQQSTLTHNQNAPNHNQSAPNHNQSAPILQTRQPIPLVYSSNPVNTPPFPAVHSAEPIPVVYSPEAVRLLQPV